MGNENDVVDFNSYRGRKQLRSWFRYTLVLVFLLACLMAGYMFSLSRFFSVRSIEVIGNTQEDAGYICELSGFKVGESMFCVPPRQSALLVSISPWVESADVLVKSNGRVIITVQERVPAALVSVDSVILLIDRHGYVLKRERTIEDPQLPFLSGMNIEYSGVIPGSPIAADELEAALTVLSSLPEDADGIGEISVADTQDIRIYMRDDTEIRLGDCSDIAKKYLVYNNILNDIRLDDSQVVHYIDVSIVDSPVYY